jgi:hypothetical protein
MYKDLLSKSPNKSCGEKAVWESAVISNGRISDKDAEWCQKIIKMLSIPLSLLVLFYLQSYFILESFKKWKLSFFSFTISITS